MIYHRVIQAHPYFATEKTQHANGITKNCFLDSFSKCRVWFARQVNPEFQEFQYKSLYQSWNSVITVFRE